MLEARNLSFSYDGETPILKSANLKVNRGEVILITGETGSGKSTLALALAGFIPRSLSGVFSGSVLIDGRSTSGLTISEISRSVALVQQDPDSQICTLKVSDEVVFGPENFLMDSVSMEQALQTSLQAVDAMYLQDRPTYAISGGERQRTAIASILSFRPSFVIFDEASANLDPKGVTHLRSIIRQLKEEGYGVVCIDHNLLAMARVADRVLNMRDGTLHQVEESSFSRPEYPPMSAPLPQSEDLLSVRDASYSYSRHTAIDNVSFSIQRGELIALMGDNGSGKTTLLGILGGLLTLQHGDVLLQSKRIQSLSKKEVARRIGMVFQNPNHQIFERTVWKEQNLALSALDLTDDQHLEASSTLLEDANLGAFRERNPFSLSHGQKRRLNVTSILAHSPEILLLDEPFVGQDRLGREFIIKTLHGHASKGGAAIIVTHDMDCARNLCTRVLFLEGSSLLLDGSPSDIMKQLATLGYEDYVEGSA